MASSMEQHTSFGTTPDTSYHRSRAVAGFLREQHARHAMPIDRVLRLLRHCPTRSHLHISITAKMAIPLTPLTQDVDGDVSSAPFQGSLLGGGPPRYTQRKQGEAHRQIRVGQVRHRPTIL